MAESIIIHKRDGSKVEFKHRGRAGGSYTIHIKYEAGFAIVIDEYENQTVFPESVIDHVDVKAGYSGW